MEALKLMRCTWLYAESWRLVALVALSACGGSGREATTPEVTPAEVIPAKMESSTRSGNAIMSLDVKGACYRVLDCDNAGSSLMAVVSTSHATIPPLVVDVRWGVDDLRNVERSVVQQALSPKPEPIRFSTHAPCNMLIELMLRAKTKDDEFVFEQRVKQKCAPE